MSDGYTPGDLSVRIAYVYIDAEHAEDIKQQRGEAFDRWLASVKAEAKAEALEGAAVEIENALVVQRRTLGMSTQQWLHNRAAAIRAAAENGESNGPDGN